MWEFSLRWNESEILADSQEEVSPEKMEQYPGRTSKKGPGWGERREHSVGLGGRDSWGGGL